MSAWNLLDDVDEPNGDEGTFTSTPVRYLMTPEVTIPRVLGINPILN